MAEHIVFCQCATYIVSISDILTISYKCCQYLQYIGSSSQILRISAMYCRFTTNTAKTRGILPQLSPDCCSAVSLSEQSKSLLINHLPLNKLANFPIRGRRQEQSPLVVESYQCSIVEISQVAGRTPFVCIVGPTLGLRSNESKYENLIITGMDRIISLVCYEVSISRKSAR